MISIKKLSRNRNSQFAVFVIGIIIFELIIIAVFGPNKSGDFRYFYVAGKCWLNQQNPYDLEIYSSTFNQLGLRPPTVDGYPDPFAYPPQFAPFCLLAALFNWPTATILFKLSNFLCAGILALLVMRLATNPEKSRPASIMPATRWLLPCLVLGMPYVSLVIGIGQTTLILGTFLVGFWYFGRRNKPILAGLLLGLATFKPQFIILPAFYFFLDKQWRILAIAAITSTLLASYSLIVIGPVATVYGWLHSLSLYQNSRYNIPGSKYVMGLPSALSALGLPTSEPFVLLLGAIVLVFIIWLRRNRLCQDDILSIILLIQFSLVYAHYFSMPLLAPVFASVWLHIGHRKKLRILAALTYILILPPQRLLPLHMPILLHYRSILIFLVLLFLVFVSWHQSVAERTVRKNLAGTKSLKARR